MKNKTFTENEINDARNAYYDKMIKLIMIGFALTTAGVSALAYYFF